MKRFVKRTLISLAAVAICSVVIVASVPRWRVKAMFFALDQIVMRRTKDLPKVDRVEIARLLALGSPIENTNNTANLFRIEKDGPYRYAIERRVILTGAEAGDFATKWRGLRADMGFSGLCHEPVYAVSFLKATRIVFQTSFCWHCSNFEFAMPLGGFGMGEVIDMGFDESTVPALEVWKALQKHLPL